MLFNSIEFALFFPLVFLIYWAFGQNKLSVQNWVILIASYFFYGWWDWRFLLLIAGSSLLDYFIGLNIEKATGDRKRKILLATSIGVNLGMLFFFKYFNFFSDSFASAFTFFGSEFNALTLDVILPVGISFYTFQTLSYSIDIYRRKLTPTNDIVSFFSFVSFFPQLVAGPIERASNLLPQFYVVRKFDYVNAVNGMRQILWGLVKKVVIADNCAEYANVIFNSSDEYGGSTLLLGAVLFAFQIYGDFSGYSDIAIGTSRLFGFDLKKNFAFPYFSRDIAEFWRRWHISLSTWFRDYLYIPLGGSKGGTWMKVRNTFIIFVVSGFWHGANWTFVFWGFLNACYFLPLLLMNKNRNNLEVVANNSFFPTIKELVFMASTFGLATLAWVFFRAENITQAFQIVAEIFSKSLLTIPSVRPTNVLVLLVAFLAVEWFGRRDEFALEKLRFISNKTIRWSVYLVLIVTVYYYSGKDVEFIYFQF